MTPSSEYCKLFKLEIREEIRTFLTSVLAHIYAQQSTILPQTTFKFTTDKFL
jgi:hypothetical protein